MIKYDAYHSIRKAIRAPGASDMNTKDEGYFKRAVPNVEYSKCSSCGMCAKVCGGQPLLFVDGKVMVDPDSAMGCLGCGQCMAICPTGAVTVTGRRLSRDALLELPPATSRPTVDQLESLLLRRRSIRIFKPKEVERETVDRILKIASTAPMGIPPSEVGVIVFYGSGSVKAFSEDIQAYLTRVMKMMNPVTLALFRLSMSKTDVESLKEFVLPLKKAMDDEKHSGRDMLLYGAPVALMFHRSPYSEPADCHIAATYAMIAAETMGLGTCMIGLVSAFMERDKALMKKYGIPKGNKPSLVLLIGYPGVTFKKALRRDFSSVRYHE